MPPPDRSEGERRLRAVVRVLWSPAIWFVIAIQVLILLLLRGPADSEAAWAGIRMVVAAGLSFVFLYGIGGVSQALTSERQAIGVGQALHAGKLVFTRFLWLILKVTFLSMLLIHFSVYLVAWFTETKIEAVVERIYPMLGLTVAAAGFIFVYWMPAVFVEQRFALVSGLRAALECAWRERRRAGFLAMLTLTPSLILAFFEGEAALTLFLPLNVIGSLMSWVAFVYCLERLQSERARPTHT